MANEPTQPTQIHLIRMDDGRWRVFVNDEDMGAAFQFPWDALQCALNGSLSGQPIGNLRGHRQSLVERDWSAGDAVGERLALHQFKHERSHRARLFQPMNRGDVGVVQRGEQLGFALKPRQAIGIAGEGLRQYLDRNIALQPRVASPIDLAHPTDADEGDDLVRAQTRTRV